MDMKTVILLWNPAIFDVPKSEMDSAMKMLNRRKEYDDTENWVAYNWHCWEHDKVSEDDRFFMLRVGDEYAGITMAGSVIEEAEPDGDRKNEGQQGYNIKVLPDTMVDTESVPFLSLERLKAEIPDFDWGEGHSGRVLNDEQARRLEVLWMEYLYENRMRFCMPGYVVTGDSFAINRILHEHLWATKGDECEVCGYSFRKVWGPHADNRCKYITLLDDIVWEKANYIANDTVWNHIFCVCPSCQHEKRLLRQRMEYEYGYTEVFLYEDNETESESVIARYDDDNRVVFVFRDDYEDEIELDEWQIRDALHDDEMDILRLMYQRFGGKPSVIEDIRAFCKENEIDIED